LNGRTKGRLNAPCWKHQLTNLDELQGVIQTPLIQECRLQGFEYIISIEMSVTYHRKSGIHQDTPDIQGIVLRFGACIVRNR